MEISFSFFLERIRDLGARCTRPLCFLLLLGPRPPHQRLVAGPFRRRRAARVALEGEGERGRGRKGAFLRALISIELFFFPFAARPTPLVSLSLETSPCFFFPSSRDTVFFFLSSCFLPSSFFLFSPTLQKTTTMRRTVKGGKAPAKKAASKSSGAQFYGPDR